MKIKKRVTIEDVLELNPCCCYSRNRLRQLFGRRKYLTLEDLDKMEIPVSHKLWLLLREDFIPAKELHLLACKFAERALRRERKSGCEPNAESWAAIKAKRDWVKAKISDEQLLTAWINLAALRPSRLAISSMWTAEEAATCATEETARLAAVRSGIWAAAWAGKVEEKYQYKLARKAAEAAKEKQ